MAVRKGNNKALKILKKIKKISAISSTITMIK